MFVITEITTIGFHSASWIWGVWVIIMFTIRIAYGKYTSLRIDMTKYYVFDVKCPTCDGRGFFHQTYYTDGGDCDYCNGTGKLKSINSDKWCNICCGRGTCWKGIRQIVCQCVLDKYEKANEGHGKHELQPNFDI